MSLTLIRKIRETIYNAVKNISNKAMPDFSVLDETELILLLEHALLDFWDKNYNTKFLTNMKMHKIMYAVAEEENLPITRSWYILGNNIHEREIVRKEFGLDLLINPRNVTLQDGRVFDVQALIETYFDIYAEFKKCIQQVIEQTNIVKTDKWTLRRWLYREIAPRKFSRCYLASLEYLAFLSRFNNLIYLKTPNLVIDDCSKTTTDLHKSIKKIKEFEPFIEMLMEFTDTIEDAILKSALNIKNNSFTLSDLDFLKEQELIFRETVWKQFAKVIAIETVKGKRKDEIKEEYILDLLDLTKEKSIIVENSQRANELDLYLSKTDFNQLFGYQEDMRKKIIEVENILQRG